MTDAGKRRISAGTLAERSTTVSEIISLLDGHMYVVVVAVICLAVLTNSLIRATTAIITTQAKERSRREIAAYIAEGTLTPEQGEQLMRADVSPEGRRRA